MIVKNLSMITVLFVGAFALFSQSPTFAAEPTIPTDPGQDDQVVQEDKEDKEDKKPKPHRMSDNDGHAIDENTTRANHYPDKYDERESFDVDINLGFQINNFTASDLINALNPEDSAETDISALLDIRFNYNLVDTDKFGLWLYGNTARTIRGTEVICEDNAGFIGCADFDGSFGVADIPGPDVAFSILRDAESLEAFVGFRLESFKLGQRGNTGRVYISHETGFASVQGVDDLADIHYSALGFVATEGMFMNSFIEYGVGKNDLFSMNSDNRKRVRIHLEREFGKGGVVAFLESEVDFDSGNGSDSVRTKIGIELPFNLISNAIKKSTE